MKTCSVIRRRRNKLRPYRSFMVSYNIAKEINSEVLAFEPRMRIIRLESQKCLNPNAVEKIENAIAMKEGTFQFFLTAISKLEG